MSSSWENKKKYWHNIVSRRWDYKWSAFSARLIVPIMGLNWLISHQKRCLEEQSQNLWSNVSHFTEQLNTEIFLLWNHDRCQLLVYSANKFGTFLFHTVESKRLYLSSRGAPQTSWGFQHLSPSLLTLFTASFFGCCMAPECRQLERIKLNVPNLCRSRKVCLLSFRDNYSKLTFWKAEFHRCQH